LCKRRRVRRKYVEALKLGIVADPHLAPVGAGPVRYHNEYRMADAASHLRLALARCSQEGVDAVALLGDLSHFGDEGSLAEGIEIAGESGLPVLAVSGNHDVLEHVGAIAEAVARSDTSGCVKLAAPGGELIGGVLVAGFSVQSGSSGTVRSREARRVGSWGEVSAVVLTHYPVISLARRVAAEGLKYPGDLEDFADVAGSLLARDAPTVVVHGHAHVRDVLVSGNVLQISCAALVEPPFEVTLLDVEQTDGVVAVRARAIAIGSSPSGIRIPVLSPAEGEWRFEKREDGWRSVRQGARRRTGEDPGDARRRSGG
jgi:Icc-related predicted phosphoesterase